MPKRPRSAQLSLQTAGDQVLRSNAPGSDRLREGARSAPYPESEHRQRRSEMLETDQISAVRGLVRWRPISLLQWLWDACWVRISKQTLSRELRALNFHKRSTQPRHHERSQATASAFDKSSQQLSTHLEEITNSKADGRPVETWFAEETQTGQNNLIHPPLGQTGQASLSATRSADRVRLYLRRDLPSLRRWNMAGQISLHDRGHDAVFGRDLPGCSTLRARSAAARPSQPACLDQTEGATRHHDAVPAGQKHLS